MTALGRHFASYGTAAAAQRDFGRLTAFIEADAPTLFGAHEALRAGLAAHPDAHEWAAFERDAAEGIAPVRFSIRFTELS